MTRETSASPRIKAAADERILIIDGAMGTMIQRHKLDEAAFRGARFAAHDKLVQGNNDLLVLTQPKAIAEIHKGYLEAGVGHHLAPTPSMPSASRSPTTAWRAWPTR